MISGLLKDGPPAVWHSVSPIRRLINLSVAGVDRIHKERIDVRMNRRTLLAGLCTAASGSGLVLGSGAFTSVSATRDVRIGIDKDDAALLALDPKVSIVEIDSDSGELVIAPDFAFNTDSQVEIGSTDDSTFGEGNVDKAAFTITNNFDDEKSVTVDPSGISDGPGTLTFVIGDSSAARISDSSHTFNLGAGGSEPVALEIEPGSTAGTFGTGNDDLTISVKNPQQ